MLRNIKTQINILIRQKGANYCFLLLLFCVLANYIRNLVIYSHIDRADVPNYLSISVLGFGNRFGWYLLSFLAFLIVLPGGTSILRDDQLNMDIHLVTRCRGRLPYYLSKIAAVFFVTFLCFLLPFLVELLLNLVAFPLESSADWTSADMIYRKSEGMDADFLLYRWYELHPVVYALLRIGVFSGLAGLMSLIPLAFSCFRPKYQAYLFMPAYLLVAIFNRTTFSVFNQKIPHTHFLYFWWGNTEVHGRQMLIYLFLNGVAALVSCLVIIFHAIWGGVEK